MANLNWDEITQEQIDKIVEKIKSYLGEENEVCRVGWALKVVLPNKIGQPNVLKKLAVRVCKTGEYRYDRSSSFQYDFDIVKVPDTEIRSFNLDRKYKEFLWKYRVTPWILSTLALIISVFSYFKPEKTQFQPQQVIYKIEPMTNKTQELRVGNSLKTKHSLIILDSLKPAKK